MNLSSRWVLLFFCCGLCGSWGTARLFAEDLGDGKAPTDAARGYQFLVNTALIPPDFDQQTIDEVWQVWPAELKQKAAAATPEQRREMIFARYGLTPRPDDPSKPLQYVVDEQGNWTMNCFACHGGMVDQRVWPGAPNHEFDLQTLTEETRKNKLRMGKPMARMDLGSVFIPLGSTRGTTNAVMFGVALMHFRDAKLNVIEPDGPPPMHHHDMDAPPWWHFSQREYIYIDGFAERSHRALMQFALVRENKATWFQQQEEPFRDVYAYLMSLQAPKYPHAIDSALSARGEQIFNQHCASCHGTYGANKQYPAVRIPIEEIGTDPVRLRSLSAEGRGRYAGSWFANFGKEETIADPDGYVAPPLEGVWASGPYFHNGSVPTLWHVLNPEERPTLWRKMSAAIDYEKVGVQAEAVERIAIGQYDMSERRRYFDTRRDGKSAAGHRYPEALSADERRAVLEYLKTL